MIDFDKLFNDYLHKWIEKHKDSMTADEMENEITGVFDEWQNSACKEIGNKSPREYFDSKTDGELLSELIEYSSVSGAPAILLDTITDRGCADGLIALINGKYEPQVKIQALNLLNEESAEMPLDKCLEFARDESGDEGLRELAVEILCDNADAVKDKIFALLPTASLKQKGIFAEILVQAGKDDRTFDLLVEMLEKGDNLALYASFLGKYGDERAARYLYKKLDDCNYADYMEVRNAIEQLGGVVDEEYRDFADDPYYQALKNIK